MNAVIDFDVIAGHADLPTILASIGVEVRNGKALCPFHGNFNTPAMTVFQIGGRWRFDCKGCGARGDAIGFVSMWHRITPIEAAKKLGGIEGIPGREKVPGLSQERRLKGGAVSPTIPPPSLATGANRADPERSGPWADPEWQEVADGIICRAEWRLWEEEWREALAWLRARGLKDHTIRRFRLGFVDECERTDPLMVLRHGNQDRGILAVRGITIPWCHPEAWYHANEPTPGPRWVGCNVRRLMPDVFAPLPKTEEKCFAFAGSRRGYTYPFADLAPGVPALVAEGEWDALIAWQEFGWVLNVVSVGGARQEPKPSALATLANCPSWLLALHNDDAGNLGARNWSTRSRGKAVRAMLPPDLDLNDMLRGGVNLLQWLRSEYDVFGWTWPLAR